MTAGGAGLLKPAPGTWGSLVTVAIGFLLGLTGEAWVLQVGMAILMIFACIACIAFGPWAEQHWGKKDPGQVVIDEVAGQALALLLLPWAWLEPSTTWLAILCGFSFIAFRILDILKPPPIRNLQKLSAGWGVLLDDLLAGFDAALLCWFVLLAFIIWPTLGQYGGPFRL
ncbi:MAG: phosphatidylglycerophosphatase A [Planctomycetota bacterium]|nr:phosphatidylglycerophosphatase A [Planctomycetota bacterium]